MLLNWALSLLFHNFRIGKSDGRKGRPLPTSETYYRLDKKINYDENQVATRRDEWKKIGVALAQQWVTIQANKKITKNIKIERSQPKQLEVEEGEPMFSTGHPKADMDDDNDDNNDNYNDKNNDNDNDDDNGNADDIFIFVLRVY